jgi:hypothetical protein
MHCVSCNYRLTPIELKTIAKSIYQQACPCCHTAINSLDVMLFIYHQERLSYIERSECQTYYGEYWNNIMHNHLERIKHFTFDELENDIFVNIHMSFNDWLATL